MTKSALDRLNEKAEEMVRREGIGGVDALIKAAENNPDLYAAYTKERWKEAGLEEYD